MPACRKKLSVDHRQEVIQIIDDVYKLAPANKKVWTKCNVLKLVKYVKVGEVFRLQAFYMTAKKEATVITRGVKDEVSFEQEQDTTHTAQQGLNRIDTLCTWKPIDVLSRYRENKQDELIQMEYFHHITNRVAHQHWDIRHANVKPGNCLDVEMSEVQ